MSIVALDYPEITGFAASGTADSTGTWNTSFDLTGLGVPSDATGIAVWVLNTISSPRWIGLRHPGKTTPHFQEDFGGLQARLVFVPIVNGAADIYAESTTNIRLFPVSYMGPNFVWFDIDAGLPEQPVTTSGASELVTAEASVPLSATMMIANVRTQFNAIGAGAALSAQVDPSFVPLDSNNQFYAAESLAVPLVGYDTDPFTAVLGTSVTVTADSTWTAAGTAFPDAVGGALFAIAEAGSNQYHMSARGAGSTFDVQSASGLATNRLLLTDVDASGNFETWTETGATSPSMAVYGYSGVESTAPTITDINTTNEVTPGASATLTGTNLTNATGLNIGSVSQAAFTVVSGTSVTFTGTRGGNPYNQDLTATLLSPDGNATITVQQVPEAGTFAVTAASPNTTDDASLWTGLVDTATGNPVTIVDGDQAWVKNPNNLTNLAIQPDGTISADETGDFVVQIRLASEGVWGSDQTVSFVLSGGPSVTIDAIPPLNRLIAGAGRTNGRLVPVLNTSRIATSSFEVGRRDTLVAPFAAGLPVLTQAVRVRVEDFFDTGAVTQIRMPSGTAILGVYAIVMEAFDLTGAASMRLITNSGTLVSGLDFSSTGWKVPTSYTSMISPTGARAVNVTLEPSDQAVVGTETTGDAFLFFNYCYR